MAQVTFMQDIIAKAKKLGYEPQKHPQYKTLWNRWCPNCGRKNVIIFENGMRRLARCTCGFTKKDYQETDNRTVVADYRCNGINKNGSRCKRSVRSDKGQFYCSQHKPVDWKF